MVDNLYWIWFQLLFGVGSRRAELFMNYFESPKEIFDGIEAKNRVAGMLSESELAAYQTAFSRAEELRRKTLAKGVDIITPDHADYPELLGQIYSKPAALYVKGDLTCLKGKLAIAMVGARQHTDYGKEAAAWIAKGLAKGDAVVVSGLAHGIDTESHMAALNAGGKSIGILGCGIDIDYPKGNAQVKRKICENGAVATEFPLGTEPRPQNFPFRNRIISGICHGTVVVEADINSGSLLTAQHALEQGRDIFAVPGSIFSLREQGTHRLIREGAKLTENAQDIFDEYEHLGFWKNVAERYNPQNGATTSYSAKPPMKNDAEENRMKKEISSGSQRASITLPEEISPAAKTIFSMMETELVTLEELAGKSGQNVAAIQTALTELEIYGLIQGYPGRKFGVATSQ